MTSLVRKPPLVDEILFLDGITRAGKFMLGKVVSNFENMEFFHYVPSLEQLPLFEYTGMMDRESTISLMQMYANEAVYSRAIGRGLNCRPDDSSSITNATDYQAYLDRMQRPAHNEAVKVFKAQKRMSPFLIHECLPQFDLYLEAFPKMKMINIQRHPVDLAHSWFKRGWGLRMGSDPLAFSPCFNQDGFPVPWFALDWDVNFESLTEMDRVVKCIVTLFELDAIALKEHGKNTNSLFVLCYEHIFERPQPVIEALSRFIGTAPLSNMNEVLKREGIPATQDLAFERKPKLKELKANTTPALMNQLMDVARSYEKKWYSV